MERKRSVLVIKNLIELRSEMHQSRVANQDDYFNVDRFNQLLGKLEASKGRQVRQKAVEGRRDTWADWPVLE